MTHGASSASEADNEKGLSRAGDEPEPTKRARLGARSCGADVESSRWTPGLGGVGNCWPCGGEAGAGIELVMQPRRCGLPKAVRWVADGRAAGRRDPAQPLAGERRTRRREDGPHGSDRAPRWPEGPWDETYAAQPVGEPTVNRTQPVRRNNSEPRWQGRRHQSSLSR